MAVSNEIKVGHIDFDSSGSGSRFTGFSIQKPEEKQAYIDHLARISVGDTDPVDLHRPFTPPTIGSRNSA